MEEKLKEIEEKLDSLISKVNRIDDWIDNLNEDFLWDFTDFDQSEMFSWFHLADSVERMESILFALNQKFNLNPEGIDLDLHKVLKNEQIKNEKLQVKIEKLEKVLEEVRNADQFNKAAAEARVQEWQRIVDEIAHSINTDVYLAVSNLEKHKDLPKIQKAFYHTKQIRDLTNLLMWYIKRNELEISGEMKKINIADIIEIQIEAIKEGIDTLRLSSDEHQENILNLNIPVDKEGDLIISINKEISDAITLVLKDIIRNGLKNTKEDSPEVKIKITGTDNNVIVLVWNNKAISEDYSSWFNNETTNEPENISQSSKVGLRVIKMWIDLLKIKAKLIPDYQNNSTTAQILFPKEIYFEKN